MGNDKKTLECQVRNFKWLTRSETGPDCRSDGPRVRTEPHERRVPAGLSRRMDTPLGPQFLMTDGLRLAI